MEAVATRLGVFRDVYKMHSSDDQDVHSCMDTSFPYNPEMSNYQVVSLTKGL